MAKQEPRVLLDKRLRETLRTLSDMYNDIQAERIAVENRLRQGEFVEKFIEFARKRVEALRKDEEKCKRLLEKNLKQSALWTEWLQHVKGVGPTLAGKLLAMIDFKKAKHISSIWKYFGLAVIGGRIQRKERGKTTDFNPEAKKLYYLLSESFVRVAAKGKKGGYRKLYEKFKEAEIQKAEYTITVRDLLRDINKGITTHYGTIIEDVDTEFDFIGEILCVDIVKKLKKLPEETVVTLRRRNKHIDMRARRKTVKVFLGHTFIVYHWLANNIPAVHYAGQYLREKGQDYIYMPVIDKPEKPVWWKALAEEYRGIGLRPIEI